MIAYVPAQVVVEPLDGAAVVAPCVAEKEVASRGRILLRQPALPRDGDTADDTDDDTLAPRRLFQRAQ
jgi:hypothetical protein